MRNSNGLSFFPMKFIGDSVDTDQNLIVRKNSYDHGENFAGICKHAPENTGQKKQQ